LESITPLLAPYETAIDGLREVGRQCWNRGWSLGTSSNYSVVVECDPLRLLITASGKDKGHLGINDFVVVDGQGIRTPENQPASSAETMLHCSAAAVRGARAVLHTHSLWSTILSDRFFGLGGIMLEGYEMLKGLEGIKTHQSRVWLPIFENTQDIPSLQAQVEKSWSENPDRACWGYLIRKHGMYTWGKNLAEATRHVEVIEFLLECFGRQVKWA
jgi:methylthioribulose-1-phosphate dehydratase